MYRLSLVVLLVVGAASVRATTSESEAAKEAQAAQAAQAARDNLLTPEGKKYDEEAGAHFERTYGDAIGKCIESVEKPDLAAFDLLIQVSKEGKAQTVFVAPDTNIGTCLADAVRAKSKFPKPPKPGYWVWVEVSPKR